ncbi:MAG: outer membrane lipoprotein carrier protein LolA [Deltaproteobacteria bacterium]|nr:outer membrane lipoprotein carrier protein LolA [Deltaproteobacteria bacterium]MBW2392831.1 outer membrane lipoprotein carrier protein LolA [Deltaproteobacteria bacterium]
MRSGFFVWALLGWAFAANAEDAPGVSERKPLPTLEGVMADLAASPGLQARFIEQREAPLLEEPVETRGRMALDPPDRFSRITETPVRTRLVLDAGELRFEHEYEASEDPMLAELGRRFAEELLLLLSGDLSAIQDRYEIDFSSEGCIWQLSLVPRSAQARRYVEQLVLRGDGEVIRSLELQEADGGGAISRFSEVRADRQLTPEELSLFFGRAPRP